MTVNSATSPPPLITAAHSFLSVPVFPPVRLAKPRKSWNRSQKRRRKPESLPDACPSMRDLASLFCLPAKVRNTRGWRKPCTKHVHHSVKQSKNVRQNWTSYCQSPC